MTVVRFLAPSTKGSSCRYFNIYQSLISKRRLTTPRHIPDRPTWSLEDLFSRNAQGPEPTVSIEELHHLLRLSALPLPKDPVERRRMQKDLQSQLQFVKAIQEIEIPDDVEPLQSIRDETAEGLKEQEVGCETLKDELGGEEVVGTRGRIRRRTNDVKNQKVEVEEEEWDPLALAPRTVGRYIAVDTAKD
ncbi:MAG: hypothetical protein Q9202_001457 [Teloschistes flavicans]